jgi:1-acyl-sn-glycerol-3-phosphate acyltransferase
MRRLLVIGYQPYKWLIYLPFLIISTGIFSILAILLATLINQKIGSRIGGALWARLNGSLIPLFVKVIGRENIGKNQSYVIVANHQSLVDVLVLYGWLGIDFRWVLKQELRKIPGLGLGCEKVGHIYIDRSDHQKAIASINAAKSKIVNGTSVVFFPEGTRRASGKPMEFKKGAFVFAIETGVPLLPVTIVNTGHILPPHTVNLLPGSVKLIIHKKIDVTGYTTQNLDALMSQARNAILAGLGEVP